MSDFRYFGKYLKYELPSRQEAGRLMGADCIVGDTFTLTTKNEDGVSRVWLVNKFGAEIAFFSYEDSHTLELLRAREWTVRVMLACVCFTNQDDPGSYWGYVAVIANDPRYDDECQTFAQFVSQQMAEGIHVQIDLSEQAIDQLIASKGTWKPKLKDVLPKLSKGSAMMKSRMTTSEKAIEQGRKKNIGCYIVGWAFIAAVVVGVIFLVKGLFGF